MKKNDIFTFTAPNGVEVTAVVLYKRKMNKDFVNYVLYEYIAYAQNELFTCTQMERVIDKENYNTPSVEYGHVLVDYAILPDYDELLQLHSSLKYPQWEQNLEEEIQGTNDR